MTSVELPQDLLRRKTLEAARRHKASWIELGQYLYTIYKAKHFRSWGFLSFETYCVKELSIKQTTASKLLKSYSFLEKEEPHLIHSHETTDVDENPGKFPDYESVNLLRLARQNRNLTPEDYAEIRQAVFEKGKDLKEIKAQFRRLLSEREEKDPAEEQRMRRSRLIRRLVTLLSNTQKELQSEGLLPGYLLKQINDLIRKLEDQLQ